MYLVFFITKLCNFKLLLPENRNIHASDMLQDKDLQFLEL